MVPYVSSSFFVYDAQFTLVGCSHGAGRALYRHPGESGEHQAAVERAQEQHIGLHVNRAVLLATAGADILGYVGALQSSERSHQ